MTGGPVVPAVAVLLGELQVDPPYTFRMAQERQVLDDSGCRRNSRYPRNGRYWNRFKTPNTLTYNPLGHYNLAFFSNRLSLQDSSTGGYRLFLTSTRDGKEWSPLRAVAIGVVDGWPLTAPCLIQRADGDCVVLWRRFAASAKSFREIHALEPFTAEEGGPKQVNYFHPQLTADGNGLVHMVFDNFGMGLCHMTSATGLSWSAPTVLVPKKPFRNVSSPQLIWAGNRALLLYSDLGGSYLAPVDLAANTIDTDRAIMITNHVIPRSDSRATATQDGEVFVPVGGDTGWMLRAKMADLLKALPPPATRPATQPAGKSGDGGMPAGPP